MRHLSLDLETFATIPTASIAVIGAVVTDAPDVFGEREFKMNVADPKGDWNPDTIRWHAKQPNPTVTTGARGPAYPLDEALMNFTDFMLSVSADVEGMVAIWSHATFDIPVLASAYARVGRKEPWHYRNCRDLRTLYDLAGGRPKRDRIGHEENHSALGDARYQLWEVEECYRRLQELREGTR